MKCAFDRRKAAGRRGQRLVGVVTALEPLASTLRRSAPALRARETVLGASRTRGGMIDCATAGRVRHRGTSLRRAMWIHSDDDSAFEIQ